jgi:rSAM/selenodomain-associated transferase 1
VYSRSASRTGATVDRHAAELGQRSLGVFAKAPVPGRVKTRLAQEIGPTAAAALYRRLGRQVVAAAVGPGYRTIVWFTPPAGRDAVRIWLDGLGVAAFCPQANGSLGTRLVHAFGRSFAAGDGAVVIIGTDAPGVNRRIVAAAFRALRTHDVVLGPSLDGGYYLIGLSTPQPALFRAIPWSTRGVLRVTEERAQALALSVGRLPPLRDVDRARDARAMGLLTAARRSATGRADPSNY